MKDLGRLEPVDLREVWKNEAGDFTPWLARAENLELLGETLNLNLELEGTEQSVGSYSADIVCRDSVSDRVVLIENQLEKTDHTHLGQIFTYAAGVDAVIIVWVARRFTDEHRAAVDWLNRISGTEFHFFGIEVEAWKIGDSQIAPRFNVVAQPNDWAKAVTATLRRESGELSTTRKAQLAYWTGFRDWVEQHSDLRVRPPKPEHASILAIGKAGAWIAGIVSKWSSEESVYSSELRAELVLQFDGANDVFDQLNSRHAEFDEQIGETLLWDPAEGSKRCRIYLRRDGDYTDENQWPDQFAWMASRLEKLRDIFGQMLKG